MTQTVRVSIDASVLDVAAGTTVAAAIRLAGIDASRVSVSGAPRGPLCGMGICFECRVEIDGVQGRRSCMTPCEDGMAVRTSHA